MASIFDHLPSPPPAAVLPDSGRKPRILVVDDQPINVKLLERKLEREWPAAVASTPEDVPRVRMFGMQLNDELRGCNRKLIEKLQKLGV